MQKRCVRMPPHTHTRTWTGENPICGDREKSWGQPILLSISSKSPLSPVHCSYNLAPLVLPLTGSPVRFPPRRSSNSGGHVAQIELVTVQESHHCTTVKLLSAPIWSETIGKHEYTPECARSLASWDKELRSGNENSTIYEAVRSYGCHFMESISICGFFSLQQLLLSLGFGLVVVFCQTGTGG